MLHTLSRAFATLAVFLRGTGLALPLALTGLFLTVRLGFPQLRNAGQLWRDSFGSLLRGRKTGAKNRLSPFQAVATALSGSVGTGNIAGVTGAVFLGGPGAVFWMWVSAFFGMATKYTEILLALRFRVPDGQGGWRGGPMYYMERGLGRVGRVLALCFAAAGTLASFGIGNLAQSGEIAAAAQGVFGLPTRLSAPLLSLAVAAALCGGLRRVGRLAGLLVPVMAGAYLLAGIWILGTNLEKLPALLALIFRSAFGLRPIGGGLFGLAAKNALRRGFSRGLFSNEAGLGSAPMAHAAADNEEPCAQAAWGVVEVFVDTFLVCSVTALSVLLSGVCEAPGGLAAFASAGDAAGEAFRRLLPGECGALVIRGGLLLFAYSSILCWGCYGEACLSWLLGEKQRVGRAFRPLFAAVCALGCLAPSGALWSLSETFNALMALPNLVALLALSATAARIRRAYVRKKPSGQVADRMA